MTKADLLRELAGFHDTEEVIVRVPGGTDLPVRGVSHAHLVGSKTVVLITLDTTDARKPQPKEW